MGAEQSSPRNAGTGQEGSTTRKTCYYELLGIERQATEEEIRKAYRKKALELHPDRNLNDVENSTQKFALVQTAYEVLSDPQERAWYDSHRDAILGGEDDVGPGQGPAGHATSSEMIFKLMGRFSSSVPMNDSPKGFFGILDAFFDQLAAEERAACEWEGLQLPDLTPFGSEKDGYDTVAKPFYNSWSSFSTRKSFSWKDKYRLSDAPDRTIRRLMEKENKKLRAEAIREFNDAVRSLVAFVRKRDPRYVPSKQSEAERQKVLRDSAATQAARSRAANQEKLANYVVPDWAKSHEGQDLHNDEFSVSEEESEVEEIECVVCNKSFKSEKQFEAHERSKKHVKAVQQLRRQMKRENDDFDLEEPVKGSSAPTEASLSRGENEVRRDIDSQTAVSNGKVEPSLPVSPEGLPEGGDVLDASAESSVDDEYAPRSKVESRVLSMDKETAAKRVAPANHDPRKDSLVSGIESVSLEDGSQDGKKIGKAKARRAKKAAKQAAEETQPTCLVCKAVFVSRSKLFDHIRELDHAGPVPQKTQGGKKKK